MPVMVPPLALTTVAPEAVMPVPPLMVPPDWLVRAPPASISTPRPATELPLMRPALTMVMGENPLIPV